MPCSPKPEARLFTPEHRILVTGASSGIGRAIALRCNAMGATVLASGRSRERLLEARDQADHPECFVVESRDLLSDMEGLPDWVKSLRERHGRLGGFVHSAGLGLTAPLRLYDLNEARALFDIHVHAPMLIARGFADRRNNIGPGAAMLFMGSSSALIPVSAKAVYASAKGALITAARSLARELGPQGIRVNALAPALVETPMVEDFRDMIGSEEFAAERQRYPFGFGRPEDVAGLACVFLSEQGRWITGQTLLMDGGRY